MKWQDCISNYAKLRVAYNKLRYEIRKYYDNSDVFRSLDVDKFDAPPMPSKGKTKNDMWIAAYKIKLSLQDITAQLAELEYAEDPIIKSYIASLSVSCPECQNIAAKSLHTMKQYFIEYDHADSLSKAFEMESGSFQSISEYIDAPCDVSDSTMLIKAAKHSSTKVINMLLEKGANPFKANKYGESAFSVLLSNHMEEHAKKCLQQFTKTLSSSLSSQDSEIILELTKILESKVTPGELEKFIAANICSSQHQGFREMLGYDDRAAKTCFDAALESYKCLGENVKNSDVSELLWCNDLI